MVWALGRSFTYDREVFLGASILLEAQAGKLNIRQLAAVLQVSIHDCMRVI